MFYIYKLNIINVVAHIGIGVLLGVGCSVTPIITLSGSLCNKKKF